MKRILGLDISTNCTGFTALDISDQGKFTVTKIGHIDTSKVKTIWEKIDVFKKEFNRELMGLEFDHIYVEAALISFRPGASNANTITKLVMFNAIVSYFVRENYGLTPEFIPSQTARKTCGIKVMSLKKAGIPVKQQTFIQVTERILPDYKITLTRTEKPKPWCYDEIDSFVVARAGSLFV